MGATFKNPNTLHGKKVSLERAGKKVNGVLLSRNLKEGESESFNFRWVDENGSTCVCPITDEELQSIKGSLSKPVAEKNEETEEEKTE